MIDNYRYSSAAQTGAANLNTSGLSGTQGAYGYPHARRIYPLHAEAPGYAGGAAPNACISRSGPLGAAAPAGAAAGGSGMVAPGAPYGTARLAGGGAAPARTMPSHAAPLADASARASLRACAPATDAQGSGGRIGTAGASGYATYAGTPAASGGTGSFAGMGPAYGNGYGSMGYGAGPDMGAGMGMGAGSPGVPAGTGFPPGAARADAYPGLSQPYPPSIDLPLKRKPRLGKMGIIAIFAVALVVLGIAEYLLLTGNPFAATEGKQAIDAVSQTSDSAEPAEGDKTSDATANTGSHAIVSVASEDGRMKATLLRTLNVISGTLGPAAANIANSEESDVDMKVTVRLKETGQMLYQSAAVRPGYRVEQIALTDYLPVGTHAASVVFIGYDRETHSEVSTAQADVTINVIERQEGLITKD